MCTARHFEAMKDRRRKEARVEVEYLINIIRLWLAMSALNVQELCWQVGKYVHMDVLTLHTHTNNRTHTHKYTQTHAHTHRRIDTQIHIHTHAMSHIYTHTHIDT